jgi:uncharacterized protein YktB (UPF0637 family)
MNDKQKAEELVKVFKIIQSLDEVESILITMTEENSNIYNLANEIFEEGQTKTYPNERNPESKEHTEPFSYDVINMIAEEMHDLGKRMKSVEKENIILAKAVALMLSERE